MTPLSQRETTSEYNKINNFTMNGMLRTPPTVTFEDQLLNVRTVINILHFLNQLIVGL